MYVDKIPECVAGNNSLSLKKLRLSQTIIFEGWQPREYAGECPSQRAINAEIAFMWNQRYDQMAIIGCWLISDCAIHAYELSIALTAAIYSHDHLQTSAPLDLLVRKKLPWLSIKCWLYWYNPWVCLYC